jgi:hypothetical protein
MTTETLEQRVEHLEEQVRVLVGERQQPRSKDWRRTIGMFDGDPVMKEIIDEGNRLREEDRRQAQL